MEVYLMECCISIKKPVRRYSYRLFAFIENVQVYIAEGISQIIRYFTLSIACVRERL